MKRLKKLMTLTIIALTLSTCINSVHAVDDVNNEEDEDFYLEDNGSNGSIADECPNDYEYAGVAYECCRTAPSISPTVAVGTVIIIAAIAVLAHSGNRNRGSSAHAHA